MKLHLTIIRDDNSEYCDIGDFEHVKDLQEWANSVTDEDVLEDEE